MLWFESWLSRGLCYAVVYNQILIVPCQVALFKKSTIWVFATFWSVNVCLFCCACMQIKHGAYSKLKSCCSVHHNISSSPMLTQHGSVGELGFTHLLLQPCLVCNLWPTPHTDLSWLSWKFRHTSEWVLQVYDDVAKLDLHVVRLPSIHGSNSWKQ